MKNIFISAFFIARILGTFVKEGISYLFIHKKYNRFVKEVTHSLVKTDVLFVKIIQSLAHANNLIDDEINNELVRYTDRVPYTKIDLNRDIIDHIKRETPYVFVNDDPFRSGMISLIYQIEHIDTHERYILKVKRNNIKARLNTSIETMSAFLSMLSGVIYWWVKIDIQEPIDKHMDVLEEQLDFQQEKENTKLFYRNFEYIDYVKVPEIIEEDNPLNNDYIIMEYIEGKSFDSVDPKVYDKYASLVTKMALNCIIINGTIHGDLHAGNLIFIENNDNIIEQEKIPKYQIGVIDLGLVVTVPTKVQELTHFAITNFQKQDKLIQIAERYLRATLYPPDFLDTLSEKDRHYIIQNATDLLANTLKEGNTISQIKVYNSFQTVNTYIQNVIAQDYKVKLDKYVVSMQVAISMSNGVTMQLSNNDFNIQLKNAADEMFHVNIFDDISESDEDE